MHARTLSELTTRSEPEKVDPPRSPAQFLALPAELRAGSWHFVQADIPDDAFIHTRSLALGQSDCSSFGPCKNCPVTTMASGGWQEVHSQLPAGIRPQASKPHVAVPAHLRRWP